VKSARHVLFSTCLALCACRPESDLPEEPTPERGNFAGMMAPLTPEQAQLQPFLKAKYGAHADARSLWWEDAADMQHQVCANAPIGAGKRLLAVCHVGGKYTDFGQVEILSLAEQDGRLSELASALRPGLGISTNEETVRAVRFGKEAFAIAIIDHDPVEGGDPEADQEDNNERYQKSVRFYAFRDGRLETVAEGRAELWDECAHELLCDQGDWTVFKYDFDPSDPDAAAWPMLVHEKGSECRDKFEREYRVEFDPASRAYKMPAPLLRKVVDCEAVLVEQAMSKLPKRNPTATGKKS